MIGKSIFLSLSLFFSAVLYAQNHGNLELEVGGVGGFGSISFSKNFASKNAFNFEYRFGLSYVPIDANNGGAIVIPALIHTTYGTGKHRADFGFGQAFTVTTRGNFFARTPLSIGYRFDPMKRLYYRIAYTPIVSYIFNFQWEHWGGVTIGLKLGKS